MSTSRRALVRGGSGPWPVAGGRGPRYNRRMRPLLAIALLTLAAGCATAKAQAPVLEPLDVPPVPPRVIVPDIEEVLPPAPESTASRPPAQRNDPPPKPPDSTTGATTTEPPRPTDPPRPVGETPRVRTPQTANDEQAEREVRAIMGRAESMLKQVPYHQLSGAAQQQYQTAQRFIRQAGNALKIRNYVFARNLADKAETLARQLGK